MRTYDEILAQNKLRERENRDRYRAGRNVLRAEKRDYIRRLKEENPCMDCGNHFPYYCMQYDHRDPSDKTKKVSGLASCSYDKINEEISKCDLVCANCHARRTWVQSVNRKGANSLVGETEMSMPKGTDVLVLEKSSDTAIGLKKEQGD
jgi:hypothetical protein